MTEYEGQLARDQALLENAKLDLERYKILWKQNSVSKQILDTQQSLVDQYIGTVEFDQGLLENAKLNLDYCYITSPIDGKIGLILVTEGNFVQTSDTTSIPVINSLDPIHVTFSITEAELPQVIKQFEKLKSLEVEAYNQQNAKKLALGNLIAIDNQMLL